MTKKSQDSKKVSDYGDYKTVEIPHLRATVRFFDLSKLKGIPIQGSAYTCILGEESKNGAVEIGIFFEDIKGTVKMLERQPTIGHEIVHAIQILCEKRSMKVENEVEHLAYIYHYLHEQLLGIHINPSK
jgi:hypothetical protein